MTKSDFREPVNIGSDEMVSMNEMAEIVLSFDNKKLPIQHIPGPEGVRGRNSDNTLIKEKLGWAPTMKLKVNLVKAAISFHLDVQNFRLLRFPVTLLLISCRILCSTCVGWFENYLLLDQGAD